MIRIKKRSFRIAHSCSRRARACANLVCASLVCAVTVPAFGESTLQAAPPSVSSDAPAVRSSSTPGSPAAPLPGQAGGTPTATGPPGLSPPAVAAPPTKPSAPGGRQPSLGSGVKPEFGKLSGHLAPLAELRLRTEAYPARGFNELGTLDPSYELVRFRPGLFWYEGANSVLVQGQGALSLPFRNLADPKAKHLEFHQLFYNRSSLLDGKLDLRLGRQEISYGEERLVGSANWTNTGRTFDAVRLSYGQTGANSADAFYSHTVNFATPQAMFWFGGVYASITRKFLNPLDFYVLNKANDGGTSLNRTTIGTRLRSQLTPVFLLDFEGAGQLGNDAGRDVGASALHLTLAQNLSAAGLGPRSIKNWTLIEEVNNASGTGTPTGNGGTFDNLFPTNHDKYGYLDYQSWRNMVEARLGTSFQPARPWVVTADWHRFGLVSAHDFWYNASGAPMLKKQNRTIDYGKNVGQEVDLTATYKPSSNVSWYGGVSQFYPGSFIQRVQGRSDTSTWVFLQTTLTY